MSTERQKNGFFILEKSAIILEKVPESALILEKGLLKVEEPKHISRWYKGSDMIIVRSRVGSWRGTVSYADLSEILSDGIKHQPFSICPSPNGTYTDHAYTAF